MAREKLDQQVRFSIASQISQRLFGISPMFYAEANTELGDSLKVMLLTAESVSEGQGGLDERLVDTGQWHHQVFSADRARAYARSQPMAEGEHAPHQVVEVARSVLPDAVELSFAKLGNELPEDAEARLILAPSYQLAALWLSGTDLDDVIVSAVPASIEELKPGDRMGSNEFLERLQRSEPIPGLGPPRQPISDRG